MSTDLAVEKTVIKDTVTAELLVSPAKIQSSHANVST